jgi:two-component system response regulator FixJ
MNKLKTKIQPKTVCIIDDDDAVRDSLQALLGNSNFSVTTYADASSFLENYQPEKINCALVDVRMPDIDGIELLERLTQQDPVPPIIIITGHGEVEMAVKALKIGAFDFIEKPFEPDALIERVNAAVRWGESNRAKKQKINEAQERISALTPRETDVLRCLLAGLSNKATAKKLALSPRTIEVHRARVMEKTKVDSLSHLVRLSVQAGLEPDDEEKK